MFPYTGWGMRYTISKTPVGFRVMAVDSTDASIFVGGSGGSLFSVNNDGTQTKMFEHKKSVKSISVCGDMVTCASYDCTASVFIRGELFDTIEGPETEVKSITTNGTYIAMGTRGKSVWVCKVGESIEFDTVLEDHYHDVKGVKFHGDTLYSFGYDGRVCVYELLEPTDSWELTETVNEGGTVWEIGFIGSNMVTCNGDGHMRLYERTDKWTLRKDVEASVYPIYTGCVIGDEMVAHTLDRDSVSILDSNLNSVSVIEDVGEINRLHWSESRDSIICGMEYHCLISIRLWT